MLALSRGFRQSPASADFLRRFRGFTSARPNWGLVVCEQERNLVIERLGAFSTILTPGLHFLIPFLDRIAYEHCLKETPLQIAPQTAITKDNVSIGIDAVVYYKIVDAKKASYGVQDPVEAISLLAQTVMRSEIGKLDLDSTFQERNKINSAILSEINAAATEWGIQCLRHEIRDISPPSSIRQSMEMLAEAERKKRSAVLDAEGESLAAVKRAEGQRKAMILEAEGMYESRLKDGQATQAVMQMFETQKLSVDQSTRMILGEKWIKSWEELASRSNSIVVPANLGDPSALIATGTQLLGQLNKTA